ncbi:hypothetical protein OUZ56_020538 [Daphnia magna]|uniref:Uncharacterized protein n=1 Tax=Daphnia magna TaxID=35525 RepID=A0ABQ9ZEP7_9CRUS|nr:hypothetical protein OUZ56_020538 [Daphnia magna]
MNHILPEKNRKLKWKHGDDNDPPQVSSNRPNNFDLIPTLPLGYKQTLISTRDLQASNLKSSRRTPH